MDGHPAERPKAVVESINTDLGVASCKRFTDKSDPNQTPYRVCPGVAGHALIVRQVDSGRQSIDIVDPAQRAFPLDFHEFVTRHMFSIDRTVEWRVTTKDAKNLPIALIVRVRARESQSNPETVTRSYLVVAKITPNEMCVTDRIAEGSLSQEEVRSAADSAHARGCLAPQPPMTVDGATVR